MPEAPHVSFFRVDAGQEHYRASTALDDVLGWFVEDGYTREQLEELVLEHVDRVMEDDEL